MREHCRTQHGFDPMPNPNPSPVPTTQYPRVQINTSKEEKESASEPDISTGQPSDVFERFLRMMRNSLELQGLSAGHEVDQDILDSIQGENNALRHLMDNFVMTRKNEVAGISGYVCKRCLTFQYVYVQYIGREQSARERHRCRKSSIEEANNVQNKVDRLRHIRTRANNCLATLANLIWSGKKYMITNSSPSPAFVNNFHGPILTYESITPTHWTWRKILNKKIKLGDIAFENFIMRTRGTYALILIQTGDLSGYHLMHLKSSNQ